MWLHSYFFRGCLRAIIIEVAENSVHEKDFYPRNKPTSSFLCLFSQLKLCVHITTLWITHTHYSFHSNTKANGFFKHTEKDKPVNASAFVSGEEIKEKEKGDLGFTIIQGATM